jgi:hypothetical protein
VGTAESNKAVQRPNIDEVINQKDLDLADELFSEEHELHPEAPGVGRDPEGMKWAFAGLHEEFPDVRVEIESMVAEATSGRPEPRPEQKGGFEALGRSRGGFSTKLHLMWTA